MGVVVRFPRHATSRALKPNKARSISAGKAASENNTKYSGGTTPFAFQLEIAETEIPASSAAFGCPPSASMRPSIVEIMSPISSEFMNLSSVHDLPASSSQDVNYPAPMPLRAKTKEIFPFAENGLRLAAIRKAVFPDGSAQDFAETFGCHKSYWSEAEAGKHRISLNVALRLCGTWGVSLDYVYLGRVESLPPDLRAQLARRAHSTN